MNLFWNTIGEFFRPYRSVGSNIYYGTLDSFNKANDEDNNNSTPSNVSTVFMCARILSSTIGMLPISVKNNDSEFKDHDLYYQLRHRMNDDINNQTIMSTLEYMRDVYGNAFLDRRNNKFEIIPIEVVDDWDYKGNGGSLRYHLNWGLEYQAETKRNHKRASEWVSSKDILHFKGMSADGVMGLPPVSAAFFHMDITNKATATIRSFYKNRAMSPMSVESTMPDNVQAGKLMMESIKDFKSKYAGVNKAGETVWLPPGSKLTPLQIHFQDAQLIETMKFSRDEICNLYGIPNFMHSSTDIPQLDIEGMTKSFKQFCIKPIVSLYKEEFKFKCLSKDEVVDGVDIDIDSTSIEAADITSLANSYAKYIQSSVISPYEASKRLGFKPSDHPAAKKFYHQMQLVALGENPAVDEVSGKSGDNSESTEEK